MTALRPRHLGCLDQQEAGQLKEIVGKNMCKQWGTCGKDIQHECPFPLSPLSHCFFFFLSKTGWGKKKQRENEPTSPNFYSAAAIKAPLGLWGHFMCYASKHMRGNMASPCVFGLTGPMHAFRMHREQIGGKVYISLRNMQWQAQYYFPCSKAGGYWRLTY